MKGTGPIVMRLENGYGFHEHGTIGSAKAEAHRLAAAIGGRFVVYVPVAMVEPMPKTQEHELYTAGDIDEELPF